LYSSVIDIYDTYIQNNSGYGASNYASDIIMENCLVQKNGNSGVYNGSDGTLAISYCTMSENTQDGVRNEGDSITLNQCNINKNSQNGVYTGQADITITSCLIEQNGADGIKNDNFSGPTIMGAIIRRNTGNGISCTNIQTTNIKNNWIVNNSGGYGIYISSAVTMAMMRGNTITHNATGGIYRSSSGAEPNIVNTIFYHNGSNNTTFTGTFTYVNYCRTSTTHSGSGNITNDPCFASPDANNYHLKWQSACVDKGLTTPDVNDETDIDGEDRVYNNIADLGADECYTSHADFDNNSRVNFIDYATFAKAWRTSTGQANWNAACDLKADGTIDYKDLCRFTNDWLWEPQEEQIPGVGSGSSLNPDGIAGQQMMMAMQPQPEFLTTEFLSAESLDMSVSRALAMEIESAESVEPIEDVFDVNETLDWLNELWQTDESIRESINETDWQEFLNSIKSSEQ